MVLQIYRTVIDSSCEPANSWNIHGRVMKASAVWLCLWVVCAFAWPLGALGQVSASQPPAQPSVQPTQTVPMGSAARGKELFTGQVRLQNGGPPCATCHSIAGLPFPNGGTLGPNLTGAYKKLGLRGMPVAVKTLYFPMMTSIYDPHPLTLEERADLLAFFKEAGTQPPTRSNTQIVALVGFLGFCALLVITRTVWRDRLQSVRRRMVETAQHQGGFLS
jgi:hypothetical protein